MPPSPRRPARGHRRPAQRAVRPDPRRRRAAAGLRARTDHRPLRAPRALSQPAEHGYSVVAMTWGPGQGTPLHDHSGLWCVEGVWHGELEITQYELLESRWRPRPLPRRRRHACRPRQRRQPDPAARVPHHPQRQRGCGSRCRCTSTRPEMACCARFQPQAGEWYVREGPSWPPTRRPSPFVGYNSRPRRCGGMVDAADSKSAGSDVVEVRVLSPVPRVRKATPCVAFSCADCGGDHVPAAPKGKPDLAGRGGPGGDRAFWCRSDFP